MSLESTMYQRSTEILFENIDNETVILNLKDGCYYGLNSTAKVLWECLASPRSATEIQNALKMEFPDLSESERQIDVEEWIQSLLEPGLVNVLSR